MKVKSKGHMALLIGSTAIYALTSVAEILIAVLTGRIVDSAIAS